MGKVQHYEHWKWQGICSPSQSACLKRSA